MLSSLGKIPAVGKVAALLWFDRLDAAGVAAFEKNIGAVGMGFEHESTTAGVELGMSTDEVFFA